VQSRNRNPGPSRQFAGKQFLGVHNLNHT
jgi:hypothetical protein